MNYKKVDIKARVLGILRVIKEKTKGVQRSCHLCCLHVWDEFCVE